MTTLALVKSILFASTPSVKKALRVNSCSMKIATTDLNNVFAKQVAFQQSYFIGIRAAHSFGVLASEAVDLAALSLVCQNKSHVVTASHLYHSQTLLLQLSVDKELVQHLLFDAHNSQLAVKSTTSHMHLSLRI